MGKFSKFLFFSLLVHIGLLVFFYFFSAAFFFNSVSNSLSNSSLQVFQAGEEGSFSRADSISKQKTVTTPHKTERKILLKNDAASVSSSSTVQNTGSGTLSENSSGNAPLKSNSGKSGGGNSSVLALIRKKIESAKRYPEAAQLRAQEGVVSIRLKLALAGSVESLSLIKSSGFKILDEEALATVRRAAPFPYYEEVIETSLRFKLED